MYKSKFLILILLVSYLSSSELETRKRVSNEQQDITLAKKLKTRRQVLAQNNSKLFKIPDSIVQASTTINSKVETAEEKIVLNLEDTPLKEDSMLHIEGMLTGRRTLYFPNSLFLSEIITCASFLNIDKQRLVENLEFDYRNFFKDERIPFENKKYLKSSIKNCNELEIKLPDNLKDFSFRNLSEFTELPNDYLVAICHLNKQEPFENYFGLALINKKNGNVTFHPIDPRWTRNYSVYRLHSHYHDSSTILIVSNRLTVDTEKPLEVTFNFTNYKEPYIESIIKKERLTILDKDISQYDNNVAMLQGGKLVTINDHNIKDVIDLAKLEEIEELENFYPKSATQINRNTFLISDDNYVVKINISGGPYNNQREVFESTINKAEIIINGLEESKLRVYYDSDEEEHEVDEDYIRREMHTYQLDENHALIIMDEQCDSTHFKSDSTSFYLYDDKREDAKQIENPFEKDPFVVSFYIKSIVNVGCNKLLVICKDEIIEIGYKIENDIFTFLKDSKKVASDTVHFNSRPSLQKNQNHVYVMKNDKIVSIPLVPSLN